MELTIFKDVTNVRVARCLRCGQTLPPSSGYAVNVARDGGKYRYVCQACAASYGKVNGLTVNGKAAHGGKSKHGLTFEMAITQNVPFSGAFVGELARAGFTVADARATSAKYATLCFVKGLTVLVSLADASAVTALHVTSSGFSLVALETLARFASETFNGLPMQVTRKGLTFVCPFANPNDVRIWFNLARDVVKIAEVNFLNHVDINGYIEQKYVDRTRVRIANKIADYQNR